MTADPVKSSESSSSWHFRIRGQVQGVGFRYFTRQEALRLGLRGWVRNCADGSVESVAIGLGDQIDLFEQAVRKGPTGSRVGSVQRYEMRGTASAESFEIVT